METKAQRRLRKLQHLCEERGGYAAVADKAGVSDAYLDQVLKGVLLPPKADGSRSARVLGDTAARKIEAAYGLGNGWFDTDDARPAFAIDTMNPTDVLKVVLTYQQIEAKLPAELRSNLVLQLLISLANAPKHQLVEALDDADAAVSLVVSGTKAAMLAEAQRMELERASAHAPTPGPAPRPRKAPKRALASASKHTAAPPPKSPPKRRR